jgi:hypothetical protein
MIEPAALPAPSPAPPLSARFNRLGRHRVWFGHLHFYPARRGGTVEVTGWRAFSRLRWTLVFNSPADLLWDDDSREANLWLVVGNAPPLALHVVEPGRLRARLIEALTESAKTPR